jgi:hypothetical protein
MKNITLGLIFTLLMLNSLLVKSQYIPFPEENAFWTVEHGAEWCMNSASIYQYQLTGDTAINSLIYHKLNQKGDFICGSIFFSGNMDYIGSYRNDSINKKVYFLHRDSLSESLLYDFNLMIGDTIKGYLQELTNYQNFCVIDSIDSLLVDGSYRKRWNYHSLSPQFDFLNFSSPNYIEGIGNVFGLFGGLKNELNVNYKLICHSVYSTKLYGHSPCNLITTIEEREEDKVSIYPNPFINNISIENSEGEKEVIITDVYGKQQYKNTYSNKTIDVSFLEQGIYFITITSATNTFTQKIIKL